MKLSELIKKLSDLQKNVGDADVLIAGRFVVMPVSISEVKPWNINDKNYILIINA